MEWTIAQARQHFSQLVKDAHKEPQMITNRNQPVAALLDVETYLEFQRWRDRNQRSLLDSLQNLGRMCHEENYQLVVPQRSNRPNPMTEAHDEFSS